MVQDKNKYVHGTAAEKLQYDVYEQNNVLKSKKKYRSNIRVKIKMTFTILAIFTSCLLLMYRYAIVTELNYNISKSDKIYNEIRNDNSRLKVQIEKEMDLAKIKEVAEKKFSMQKPDRSQMVYLNIPKQDFTVVAGSKKNIRDVNMFETILNKVNKFFEFAF